MGECFFAERMVRENLWPVSYTHLKATIRDRYFNAACATPALVFPILIKLKNSHIKKIEREKESAKRYYENLLMEIIGKLGEEYPKRLSLEEQGKFTIGYYHQMQKKYEKKGEKTNEGNEMCIRDRCCTWKNVSWNQWLESSPFSDFPERRLRRESISFWERASFSI